MPSPHPPPTPRKLPPGTYAIEPQALSLEILPIGTFDRSFELAGDVAIVKVCGPLCAEGWCDTYEAVVGRVRAAVESEARAVVIRFDTPGGDVAGMVNAAYAIRRLGAQKPIIAYVSDRALSGGYALASACREIITSPTGMCGSIGVVATSVDTTRADAAMGLRFSVVTSGARKADGNPHTPITDEAIAATQFHVDVLAGVFFDLVAEFRDLESAELRALEAGIFVGAVAAQARLADRVMTWDEVLAHATDPQVSIVTSSMPDKDEKAKAEDKKDEGGEKDSVRVSLAKAADAGDERAKKALKAYDEEDKKPDAEAEPPKEDEKKDDDKDEKKEAKAAVGVSASEIAKAVAAEITARAKADAEAKAEATARAQLYAEHGISTELQKTLDKLSLPDARAVASTLPRANPMVTRLASAPAQGTPYALSPNPELDAAMGLGTVKTGVRNDGCLQAFGVPITETK